jgi:hypothetical protein
MPEISIYHFMMLSLRAMQLAKVPNIPPRCFGEGRQSLAKGSLGFLFSIYARGLLFT